MMTSIGSEITNMSNMGANQDHSARLVQLQELLTMSSACSSRGLHNSAKWSAELAESMIKDLPQDSVEQCTIGAAKDAAKMNATVGDQPLYMLAKTYYDLREFQRAAHVLRDAECDAAVFLRCYCRYLAGEERKEDECHDLLAPQDQNSAVNEELREIRNTLSARESARGLDGFGYYLLGTILSASELKVEAREAFIKSIEILPTFWGSWLELASLCTDVGDRQKVNSNDRLPQEHWMKKFFDAHVSLELHQADEAVSLYSNLAQTFPVSSYVQAQVATAYYNRREFDVSEEIFEGLRQSDPYRLDNVDTYSNILYVRVAKTKLSYLAHEAVRIGQYRAETCCVVGNYYSLKNRHEKAVIYFQRALKLNRSYLSAWTLMGHEYMELKNSAAAIEAYRRAVEIDPRDYRAWYGLGQAYELLKMAMYSLYYYRQAQRLRPHDARMWSALAHTYKEMDRYTDAAMCYERTIGLSENDTAAVFELAVLYRDRIPNKHNLAAKYFGRVIELHDDEFGSAVESEHTVDACMFLSQFFKDRGDLDQAETYAMRLMNVGGKHKESAKELLGEIHSLPPSRSSRGDGTPRSVSGTPTFLHMLDTSDISRDPGASSPANNGDDMPSWF
eukprot:m.251502 g.251502  ORF g.251502 m.251502 type:complete len:618 (+) comp19539_c0_seq4:264-2117(+)